MPARVEIHELRESDLADVQRFQQLQVEGGEEPAEVSAASIETSRWYLFENPEAREDLPKGFVARDEAGRVVGVKQCAPQRFRCGDQEFVLLVGGGYYVDREHRGVGLRLMRAYLATGDRVSHFASTMNEVSGAIYERYGGYPIPNTEHELIGLLSWPPFLEEVLGRRLGRPALARAVAAPSACLPARIRGRGEGELHELRNPTELSELAIETPPEHAAQITASRNARFLHWRYFEGPDPARHVFVYRHTSGASGLVAARLQRRGQRGQIRTLSVLDYWGALPQSAIVDVARQLAARFRDEADMVVFRGQPRGRQAELRKVGFMHRPLPRAIGVCIDAAARLPTREWYMVPADGDMSIGNSSTISDARTRPKPEPASGSV